MWEDLDSQDIASAKRDYGIVFRFDTGGGYAYFRAITREEAAVIGLHEGLLDGEQEDEIIRIALLHPSFEDLDIDSMDAGMPGRIVSKVLDVSCLSGAEALSRRFNELKDSKTIFHTISSTICSAFPFINPYELDSVPITRLLELLMMAEEALLLKMMVSTGQFGELDFTGTEDEELTQEQRDAKLREALESGTEGVPVGWVDKTPEVNPSFRRDIQPPDSMF